jgi:hypothetical protein
VARAEVARAEVARAEVARAEVARARDATGQLLLLLRGWQAPVGKRPAGAGGDLVAHAARLIGAFRFLIRLLGKAGAATCMYAATSWACQSFKLPCCS